MRLLWMTVTWICSGLSAGLEECYGKDFQLPLLYTPLFYKGPVYFTQHGEGRGSRRTIMNNGKSNHPRLKVDVFSTTLTDLRETDEGTYSIDGKDTSNTVYLTILECAEKVTKRYGHAFSLHVPGEAQYLEFIQLKRKETTVLWNRTGSKMTKGKVQMKWNIIDFSNLTQADEGYYNLRRKDNTLVNRKKLKVEANQVHYEAIVNNYIIIQIPLSPTLWTVTYYMDGETEGHTLINNGTSLENTDPNMPFKKRFSKLDNSFEIYPVESTDSGYFYFRDQDGNLAETVRLQVLDRYLPAYVYIIVPILIILVLIGCCCCVKKCCCEKSSSKRTESTPAVQHQDRTQPSVTYSVAPAPPLTSNHPVRPVAPTDPAAFSTGPLVAAPSQPTASPAGFDVKTNFLSTDVEPTFELRGSTVASAPLLRSDSTSADVFTSDKLNFL